MSAWGQNSPYTTGVCYVWSWRRSRRYRAKTGNPASSVVLTRRFESSLRAPLHASDGAHRYLGKVIDMVIEAVSAGELDKVLKAALGERRVKLRQVS